MPSLHLTASVRRAEAQALSRLEPLALMRRAARALSDACAREARRRPAGQPIIALVGPGNNGGDALLAAIDLRARGFDARALRLDPRGHREADAQAALDQADQAQLPFLDTFPSSLTSHALFIDGLFGIGLSRPLAGEAARWVAQLNSRAAHVIAVDIPSGIDADTGTVVGGERGVAVQARHTLTFIADKPGLRTGAGRTLAGRVQLEPLGLDLSDRDGTLVTDTEARVLARPLSRCPDSHKGSFGHVAVLGGSPGMRGAALLAALGAQRSGAGKVSVGSTDGWQPDPGLFPHLMTLARGARPAAQFTAWVIGCGMGQNPGEREALLKVLTTVQVPRVFDADALNLIAGDRSLRQALRVSAAANILTPHPLEAARLLDTDTASVQADRLGAACRLADKFRSIIVLKGAGTVCAHPGGQWAVINAGGPSLATAGTGDVLAGVIGGLLGQGLSPASAACLGAWAHGTAGEQAGAERGGDLGMAASELPDFVAQVLNTLLIPDRGPAP